MCGICGFNWTDELLIHKMSQVIAHRGPDSFGYHIDKNVSLGHRRLSIIDLSNNASQPMSDSEGKIWIVYNGEVYNFMNIRIDLETKGYKFKSKSDTEVIIYAYKEYGVDCLKMFNGMFALCIYDLKKKTLIIARDKIGIKPLYYYNKNKKFMFASEIKAILEYIPNPAPNNEAIIDYFTFQNILDEKTLFKEINLLLPGTYILYDLDRSRAQIKKYWDLKFSYDKNNDNNMIDNNVEEYKKQFRKTFDESVNRHMISDVPVGAYLSGGFDSGSVTAAAAIIAREKKKGFKLNTFTAEYMEGGYYNETECSTALAKKYHAIKNNVMITPKDFLMGINKLIYHLDEPKVGLPAISGYYVAKRASKDVTVVLTGHAGDELFLGYPVYKAFYLKSLIKKNPLNIFQGLRLFKPSEIPRAAYFLFFPFFDKETKNGLFIMFNHNQRKQLFHKEFYDKMNKYNPILTVEKYYHKEEDMLENLQRLYIKTYLPSMLIVEDKISMAHSIEGRIPFCDDKMIELSMRTPTKVKLHNNTLKYLVKESMRDRLPNIFYKQQKKGFPTPLSLWFRNELKDYAYEILLSDRMKSRKIFNHEYIKKLLDKHTNSKTDGLLDLVNSARIWSLINIELWFRIFIDKDQKMLREIKKL